MNGVVLIPVIVFPSILPSTHIVYRKEIRGVEKKIGTLLITEGENVDELSIPKLKSRLLSHEKTEFGTSSFVNGRYTFLNSYFLINAKYASFVTQQDLDASPFWGNFIVKNSIYSSYTPTYLSTPSRLEIDIKDKYVIDHKAYDDSLKSVYSTVDVFSRYIYLYHLLELKFDLHSAQKIREALDKADYVDMARQLHDFDASGIPRIISICTEFLMVDRVLESLLHKASRFPTECESIVGNKYSNEYGFKSKEQMLALFAVADYHINSLAPIFKYGHTVVLPGPPPVMVFNVDEHKRKLLKLAAFWVYRLRNAAVHRRFGEFIINDNFRSFYVDFGEPLLKHIVYASHKK